MVKAILPESQSQLGICTLPFTFA